MHIWHIGVEADGPVSVGGVNAAVWRLARWQVAQGADVSLIVPDRVTAEAQAAADAWGIVLRPVPMGRWFFDGVAFSQVVARARPDLAVLHSVFMPRLLAASRRLRGAGVPQAMMAHGALAANALRRSSWRKRLFFALFERPRLMAADAVLLCTPSEQADIRRLAPRFRRPMPVLYNPIDLADFATASWAPPPGRPTALFIGRLDVVHKGIDRLFALAAELPDVDFRLYGALDPRYAAEVGAMVADAPPNLHLLPPVFGAEKLRAYAEATLMVLPSRWEGFPLVACEAMAVGTPVALSSDLPLAHDLSVKGIGLLLPADPVAAGQTMRRWLGDGAGLARVGAAGKAFARENFDPQRQALAHLAAYGTVLAAERTGGAKALCLSVTHR